MMKLINRCGKFDIEEVRKLGYDVDKSRIHTHEATCFYIEKKNNKL